MSEYIIDTEKINELNRGNVTSWLSPYAISDTSVFPPRIKETHFAVALPEIVRCRDCVYCYEDKPYLRCKHLEDWIVGCVEFDLEPDGFCAWAERKVDV